MSQTVFEFDGAIWVTLAELARRKSVARASVSERVRRLEKDGKISVRKEGRNKLVNLAEYDMAVGQVGDAVKEQNASRKDGLEMQSLRDAQADQSRYRAELLRLELLREEGKTRTVQEIEEATVKVAQALVRETERFTKYSEDIARAAGGKDLRAARIEGKKVAIKLRELIYKGLSAVAADEREVSNAQTDVAVHRANHSSHVS